MTITGYIQVDPLTDLQIQEPATNLGGVQPTKRNRAIKRKHYFTLIEVIISMGIFSLIALSCLTLLQHSTSVLDTQTERSQQMLELQRIDRSFRQIVTNSVAFSWPDGDGKATPLFIGEPERMRIMSQNQLNQLEDGGLRLSEIFLNDNQQLVIKYMPRPLSLAEVMPDEALQSVLAEDVSSISFTYASTIPNEEKNSTEISAPKLQWQDEWESERLDIPLAIRIQVKWATKDVTENFLYRTSGNSAFERLRNWKQWEEKP